MANPILQVFRLGEAGVDSGVNWPISDDPDVIIVDDLTVSTIPADVDTLMVAWEGGQTRVPASGTITSLGFVNTAAKTLAVAQEWGAKALAHQNSPDQYSVTIHPTGVGDIPGIDCLPGDTVHFADGHGGTLDERLMAWKLSLKGDDVSFEVTVASRQLVEFEALDRLLNQTGSGAGSLGGQASSQPLKLPPRISRGNITNEETFQFDAGTAPAITASTDVSESKNFWAASIRVDAAYADDILFAVYIDGIEMLGGQGILPAGSLKAVIPTFPGRGVSTKWMKAYSTPIKVEILNAPTYSGVGTAPSIIIKTLFA